MPEHLLACMRFDTRPGAPCSVTQLMSVSSGTVCEKGLQGMHMLAPHPLGTYHYDTRASSPQADTPAEP